MLGGEDCFAILEVLGGYPCLLPVVTGGHTDLLVEGGILLFVGAMLLESDEMFVLGLCLLLESISLSCIPSQEFGSMEIGGHCCVLPEGTW